MSILYELQKLKPSRQILNNLIHANVVGGGGNLGDTLEGEAYTYQQR